MSAPHEQGALGPESKTKPGDLQFESTWETKRTITHEEAREIAARLIASHFRRTDCETARAGIPARPDYDDDLLINSYIKQQARKDTALSTSAPASGAERTTAGEVSFKPGDLVRNARYDDRDAYPALGKSAYVQAVEGDYLDFGRGCKLLYSLFDLVTPAPATPPGVPDSVRALSEAALAEIIQQCWDALTGKVKYRDTIAWQRPELCKEFAKAILATHPAGQSAGAGAGGKMRKRPGDDRDLEALKHDLILPTPDSPRTVSDAQLRELRNIAEGRPPGSAADEHVRARLKEAGLAVRRDVRPWDWSLTEAGHAVIAPDSTRTGDEGTEWVLVPMRMDVGMIAAFWRWKNTGSDTPGELGDDRSDAAAYRAMIAARPAAPEAQGAWRPIAEAPKDGSEIQVFCEDTKEQFVVCWRDGGWQYAYYGPKNVRIICGPDFWRPLPAPPSSSGQGGR